MEKEIKYYTSSDGKKTPMNEVHTEHLINSLSKKYREIFSSDSKDNLSSKIKEINGIKEEIYKRINDFNETLEK